MTAAAFSPVWYRVAKLHPRLRAHVRVLRRKYRGETWHVLEDPISGRYHRLNDAAYAFIGRCDGTRSVDAISEALLDLAPDQAPTQDEIVALLSQLNQRGLIQCENLPDVEAIFQRRDDEHRAERRRWANPLAFKLRLGSPDKLLRRFDRWRYMLFSWQAMLLWLLLIVAGAAIALTHWNELATAGKTWLETPRFLLIAWLLYPPMKLLHEMAHGLAIRRFGGNVRHVGISLLVLLPAPYVDASAASALRHRSQRMLITAAGIATEMALAAAALLIWSVAEPGMVRDVALVVAFVGTVSTLLFNANPLLPFDGYHLLCDAFDLPNLSSRSRAFWRYLIMHRALGVSQVPSPEPAPGEKPWLAFYAPASWLYKVALSIAIVGWIGSMSSVLGALAGIGMLTGLLVLPVVRGWRDIFRLGWQDAQRRRSIGLASLLTAAVIVMVGLVPLPFNTVASGVVWIPEQAQLRTGADGFIEHFHAAHGAEVAPGQALVQLRDNRLAADAEGLRSLLQGLDADLFRAMQDDLGKIPDIETRMRRARQQLDRMEELQRLQTVTAGVPGRLAMPGQADRAGGFVPRGTLLGFIFTGEPAVVRVAVEQDVAALVRDDTRGVEVRLREAMAHPRPARLLRAVPAAAATLPSAALGDHAAGAIATDPADPDHLRTVRPVFLFDVAVDGEIAQRAGGRAWVRFDHGWAPLAVQWGRHLKQLFLRDFNPAA